MASEKPSAAVAGFFALLAHHVQNMTLSDWASAVAILAGAASFAVSLRNLLNKPKNV